MGGNGPQPTLELCGAIGSETIIARGAPHLRRIILKRDALFGARPLRARQSANFFRGERASMLWG